MSCQADCLFHPVLRIAVNAAVNLVFPVHKLEGVKDSLLYGSDAARVFALYHVLEGLRKLHVVLSFQLSVLYDVYCDIAVDVTQHIEVKVDNLVDFDDVLFSVLGAVGVLDDCHAVVYLVKSKELINLHALSCLDMV